MCGFDSKNMPLDRKFHHLVDLLFSLYFFMLFDQKLFPLCGAFDNVLRILFKSPPFARTTPSGLTLIGALLS